MATEALDKLLGRYPVPVRELALEARRFILEALPKSQEVVDPADGVVGFGYGAAYKDLISTLILSQSGVKLGIVRGATLPDPDGLLEGRGKVHRYVSLRSSADLRRTGLASLMKAALAAWRARSAPRNVPKRAHR